MKNVSYAAPLRSDGDYNDCHVIKPGNASLAAEWENIPETLILNGVIGVLLFVIFVYLTYIGWRDVNTEDRLKNQNIVTFLYGYRDPEQWYVIPRFEFLRHEDRHHQHDLNYPYIYAPPKLPLANPFDVFAFGNQEQESSKSLESQDRTPGLRQLKLYENKTSVPEGGRVSSDSPNQSPELNAFLDVASKQSADSITPSSPVKSAHSLPQVSPATPSSDKSSPIVPSRSTLTNASGKSTVKDANKNATPQQNNSGFNQSFFYPSILTAEQLQASALSRKLNRFFAIFFRVTDADIIYARGIDAYEYLLFQRHLILIAAITCVLCLGVILPIHWFAGSQDLRLFFATSFQRSTIKNIASYTHFHWAHIVCSGLIVVSALKIMDSYRESIISPNDQQLSRRTLLIGNIPTEQRSRNYLLRVLREHFPNNTIEAIQFVYDTAKLDDYETYLSSTIVARDYCQAYKRKYNQEIYVHTTDVNSGRVCDGYCRCCSFCYICCCFWPHEAKEPGTSYYAKEENLYREKIAQTCEKLVKEPAEYAFVTFKSHRQAKRVMQELVSMKQDVLEGRPASTLDRASLRQGKSDRAVATSTSTPLPTKPPPPPEVDSSLTQKKLAPSTFSGQSLKILELSDSKSNDLLDPRNNPHVRSIRSPAKLEATKSSVVKLPSAINSGERKGESSISVRHRRDRHLQPFEVAKHLDGPIMWSVRYAPHPDNVEFQDLLNLSRTSKYTIIFLHLLMVVIFIFITTPNVILSMIERISVLRPDKAVQLTGFQGLVINYSSILLQIITTALLPALVTLISKQIPYEDSASKGHSVMWKVFSFLILMVIIMPSIGMSSALAFFEGHINAKCLFPTDNGAYYINYIISSIFLSTMLELIKPIDILSYYFILWTSRSTAEIEGGRQFIEREFSIGLQHTGVLLIFAVMMTYCISCPLIAPVGLIYLIVKHAVDHYNLYYTYFTKKVDKDLQSTIVIFVKVALLLMLFQTTVAIYIHTGTSYFSLISQIIFWITLAAFVFNCFFHCASGSQPQPVRRSRYQHDFCACFYLPRVISSLLRISAIPPKCVSRKV